MKTNSCLKTLAALTIATGSLVPALHGHEPGQACFSYLWDHPYDASPGWHNNAQGMAHTESHWIITQMEDIWRIPVGHNLGNDAEGASGVSHVTLDSIPDLVGNHYDHFGDPECFLSPADSRWYVFVPLDGISHLLPIQVPGTDDSVPPAIAVFDAGTLEYLGLEFPPMEAGSRAKPWCAFDKDGFLFAPVSKSVVRRYEVDWLYLKLLRQAQATPLVDGGIIRTLPTGGIQFTYWDGSAYEIADMQGGAFSPNGELLYVSSGDPDTYVFTDGISVFDVATGRLIRHSTRGSGVFRFDFTNNDTEQEEPQGITFWDLDDGRAPGITGQLHVLMLDNDISADEVNLKHYSSALYVNKDFPDVSLLQPGSSRFPFNTVVEANDETWNGGRIRIHAGNYAENLTFSKHITVEAIGGAVTIGK